MSYFTETMGNLLHQTAFFNLTWGNFVMILVACIFLYLAIAKGFEPLLLVPIAFGMLLVNIYPDIFAAPEQMSNGVGGLFHYDPTEPAGPLPAAPSGIAHLLAANSQIGRAHV